jgi:hypothetical protein
MDDESNLDEGKKEGAKDLEEMGGVPSLSAGAVCQKKYEEPGKCVSSANFLLGTAIKEMGLLGAAIKERRMKITPTRGRRG